MSQIGRRRHVRVTLGRASPSRVRAASLGVCGADACGACVVAGGGRECRRRFPSSRFEQMYTRVEHLSRTTHIHAKHSCAILGRQWRFRPITPSHHHRNTPVIILAWPIRKNYRPWDVWGDTSAKAFRLCGVNNSHKSPLSQMGGQRWEDRVTSKKNVCLQKRMHHRHAIWVGVYEQLPHSPRFLRARAKCGTGAAGTDFILPAALKGDKALEFLAAEVRSV
mmetsp:Transcript_39318/g.127243  ORF Transcript_39318/g.127243 Transcript_39318/m.127243 type:complete len:222 (+) Transcript_39318:254-919(+)